MTSDLQKIHRTELDALSRMQDGRRKYGVFNPFADEVDGIEVNRAYESYIESIDAMNYDQMETDKLFAQAQREHENLTDSELEELIQEIEGIRADDKALAVRKLAYIEKYDAVCKKEGG